jgi:hypothetical protein
VMRPRARKAVRTIKTATETRNGTSVRVGGRSDARRSPRAERTMPAAALAAARILGKSRTLAVFGALVALSGLVNQIHRRRERTEA